MPPSTTDGYALLWMLRRPYLPAAPVPVDCARTERVGAVLEVEGFELDDRLYRGQRSQPVSKRPRVEYRWQHSAREDSDRRYQQHEYLYGSRHIRPSLRLSNKDRVYGVLLLRVSHDGEVVYETSFELIACPEDGN